MLFRYWAVQRYKDYLYWQRDGIKKSRAHHCGRLRQEKNLISLINGNKHKYVVMNKKSFFWVKMAILTDCHLRVEKRFHLLTVGLGMLFLFLALAQALVHADERIVQVALAYGLLLRHVASGKSIDDALL